MAILEKKTVFNKKGHPMNINAVDFDEKIHFEEDPTKKKEAPKEKATPAPSKK